MSKKCQTVPHKVTKPVPQTANAAQKSSKNTQISPVPTSFRKRYEKDTFDEVADMARSGYHLAKRIADLVNIESKCYYIGQLFSDPVPHPQVMAPTWSTMTPVIINRPELGDNDYQRISDSIKIQHLDVMFNLKYASATNGRRTYRVIIYWDETNSTTASTDILEAGFFGTSLIVTIPKDWEEKSNTKILYDENHYIEPTYPSTAAIYAPINWRVSMPINKHTQFDNGSRTIVTGALKMFACCDEAATGDTTLEYTARIIYTDD